MQASPVICSQRPPPGPTPGQQDWPCAPQFELHVPPTAPLPTQTLPSLHGGQPVVVQQGCRSPPQARHDPATHSKSNSQLLPQQFWPLCPQLAQ